MYGKVLFQCDITQFTSRVGNNTGPSTHVIKYLILEFRSCLNLNESMNLCIIFYAINEQMDECLTFFTLMLCIKYILIKSWGNHWSMKSTIYVHHNLDQIMKLVCWIFHVIFYWLVTSSLVFLFFTEYIWTVHTFCLQKLYYNY